MANVDNLPYEAETGQPPTQAGHSLAIDTPLGKDVAPAGGGGRR